MPDKEVKESSINPISSINPSRVYTGDMSKPVKRVFTIIYPDGSCDDVQYTDINKATKALTEIEELNDYCIKEAIAAIDGRKTDDIVSDWVWDNIVEIGKELGYRLNEILK